MRIASYIQIVRQKGDAAKNQPCETQWGKPWKEREGKMESKAVALFYAFWQYGQKTRDTRHFNGILNGIQKDIRVKKCKTAFIVVSHFQKGD